MKQSDIAPTPGEVWRQMVRGLHAFGVTGHPGRSASMLRYALPRHGLTPAAAVLAAALVWGDRTALTDQWGSLTHRGLGVATVRMARGLAAAGIAPGTRVAVMVDDDRFMLIATGAASLCGATIEMFNPRLGKDDLAASLTDHRVAAVIHSPGCESRLSGFSGIRVSTADDLLNTAAGPVPSFARQSALVMLTGGTTSAPTAIPVIRRWTGAFPLFALAGQSGVEPGVPTLICAPLFHGYGFSCALLCLVAGSPMVLSSACRPGHTAQLDKGKTATAWGQAMYDVICREGVGSVIGVPAQFRSLARYLADRPRQPGERVTAVVSGADRLDGDTIEAFQRRWGPVVTNYYGTTESGTVTMIAGADLANRPTSLGRPVAGSRVRIVDDQGAVLPRGVQGHIQLVSPIASVGKSSGWRAWYTTSDIGWVDGDGYLYLAGRAGPKQRVGGEFVNLSMVEDLLAGADGVDWARASIVDDDIMGRRVTAQIGTSTPKSIDVEHLRREIRDRLGPAAVPVGIDVIG